MAKEMEGVNASMDAIGEHNDVVIQHVASGRFLNVLGNQTNDHAEVAL